MKKVTTNITFGQILFILLTVVFASLMFFYLGAKFGPQVLNMAKVSTSQDESLLPDEQLAQEMRDLLKNRKQTYLFHDALQNSMQDSNLTAQDEVIPAGETEISGNPDITLTPTSELVSSDNKSDKPLQASVPKVSGDPVVTQDKNAKTDKVVTSTKAMDPKLVKTTSDKTEKTVTENTAKSPVAIKQIDQIPVKIAEPKVIPPTLIVTKNEPVIDEGSSDETGVQPMAGGGDNKEVANLDSDVVDAVPQSVYALQLDSFSDEGKAQKALSQWQKRGFDVNIVTSEIQGKGKWYRLHVGRFESKDAVLAAQKNVMQKFKQSSRVVELVH